VPVWHAKAQKYVDAGKLIIVGLVQEQHPDRCRLFLQWHKIGWPMMHDPINLTEQSAVPIVTAIDEYGIVRMQRPNPDTFEEDFLNKTFPKPDDVTDVRSVSPLSLSELRAAAQSARTASAWRTLGDALALWGAEYGVSEAIDSYRKAVDLDPKDAAARFRQGVCYRKRYDSPLRQEGDFQRALNTWQDALDLNPNQYIWRRRIQQYGPRLDKPYPFYDWVAQARADILARGEKPVELVAEPTGAEIASPSKSFAASGETKEPDPGGRIGRDAGRYVHIETALAPARVRPGAIARVHVVLRPDASHKAHWNNEAEPLRLWLQLPERWGADQRLVGLPNPKQATSAEVRQLNFEVRVPEGALDGTVLLPGYALYNVCEGVAGQCLFRRQDFQVTVQVSAR
jgi:tetratricopeptide (TPR) repeat protein